MGKQDAALLDEIYVQLMKQLTSNPSVRSATSGWELFQKLVETTMPTQELRDFVRAFLMNMTTPPKDEEEKEKESSSLLVPRRSATRSRAVSTMVEAESRVGDAAMSMLIFK